MITEIFRHLFRTSWVQDFFSINSIPQVICVAWMLHFSHHQGSCGWSYSSSDPHRNWPPSPGQGGRDLSQLFLIKYPILSKRPCCKKIYLPWNQQLAPENGWLASFSQVRTVGFRECIWKKIQLFFASPLKEKWFTRKFTKQISFGFIIHLLFFNVKKTFFRLVNPQLPCPPTPFGNGVFQQTLRVTGWFPKHFATAKTKRLADSLPLKLNPPSPVPGVKKNPRSLKNRDPRPPAVVKQSGEPLPAPEVWEYSCHDLHLRLEQKKTKRWSGEKIFVVFLWVCVCVFFWGGGGGRGVTGEVLGCFCWGVFRFSFFMAGLEICWKGMKKTSFCMYILVKMTAMPTVILL